MAKLSEEVEATRSESKYNGIMKCSCRFFTFHYTPYNSRRRDIYYQDNKENGTQSVEALKVLDEENNHDDIDDGDDNYDDTYNCKQYIQLQLQKNHNQQHNNYNSNYNYNSHY